MTKIVKIRPTLKAAVIPWPMSFRHNLAIKEKKMSTKIFVNLPVKDLPKSMAFYEALGFKNNPQFTDDTAACMVISEDIFVMLLTHPKFKAFTPKDIGDAKKTTQVLNALSRESRAEVDEIVKRAKTAGGATFSDPTDHGFMYHHAFEDLDGHIWEAMWMDPSFVQKQD
jgi:predicted lactoylglutathione lyase